MVCFAQWCVDEKPVHRVGCVYFFLYIKNELGKNNSDLKWAMYRILFRHDLVDINKLTAFWH